MKKYILPIFLTACLLSGCSSYFIKTTPNLVGNGNVYDTVTGLTVLEDNESKAIIQAFNKKYSKQKITSSDIDMTVNAKLNVDSGEYDVNLKMDLKDNMTMDLQNEKACQKISGAMEVFGSTIDLKMESYVDKEDGTFYSYSNTTSAGESSGWKKEKLTNNIFDEHSSVIDNIDPEKVKSVYKDKNSNFYVLEMDGEAFGELNKSMYDTIADTSDFSFDLAKSKAYLTLDPGISLVGYFVDLKDGIEMLNSDISVSTFQVSFIYNSINEKINIKIPSEAKSASLIEVEKIEPTRETTDATDPLIKPENPIEPTSENPTKSTDETMETQVPEQPVSETPANSSSGLVIDGVNISLPCSVNDFQTTGLTLEEDPIIDSGWFDCIALNTHKDDMLLLDIDNLTDTSLEASKCTVTGFSYNSFLSDSMIHLSLFGIETGMDQGTIEAILGEPFRTYNGSSGYLSNDYKHNSLEISITYYDGVATGIDASIQ